MSSVKKLDVSPRERLLRAGRQVFSERGYESGSLNDIAANAGMSRHNLLYYFPSKEALLLAVLDERDAQNDVRLDWMEASSNLTFSDFMEGFIRLLPDIYGDRELVQLYHRLTNEAADPEHPAHKWVTDRYSRVRSAARRFLDLAASRGELKAGQDTEALSVTLLAAIEGIEAQWLVDPSTDWLRANLALRDLVLGVNSTA